MATETTTTPSVTGWCDTRDVHDGGYDHTRTTACVNFVSDAEHTARLLDEARQHDRHSTHRYPCGATTREAAYVQEHRPY